MFSWLSNITHSKIESFEDIEEFNSDYEDSCDDENFIYIHEFEVIDDLEEEA